MLITLEGIDGSGKTTVWEALHETVDAAFTREPTDSWYGEAVARSIGDPDADPLAELFLYTADHAAHLSNTVRPALDAGEVVIADRYSDSRYAYQGAALDGVVKRPMEYVRGVHQPWTRPPDATIYLDLDPEQGAARSGATNKFEQVEYLDRVRTNYEQLLAYEPDRFVRIDASQSPETVIGAAEAAIERLLDTTPE
ncbi:dTMP kinase [Halobacteriales archaeon QH_9_66_26]|jgi:dTMP kinase|nr:MAG: dTMP kinase [Halobacteriales archaeon QH_9_66_26]